MSEPVIEARAVARRFRSGPETLEVLRRIDLAVAPGEIVSVVGPSGSGKSTLLHILGTLDRPTEGEVRVDGRPTGGLGDRALATLRNRTMGFVFQFHHLLPELTALENVALPGLLAGRAGPEVRRRAADLLTAVGLEARAAHRPGELSGGERQRVAVARALFNGPRVVLADEPTGDLDEERADVLERLLLALPRDVGAAVVVATHDRDLARRADRTLALHNGELTRI